MLVLLLAISCPLFSQIKIVTNPPQPNANPSLIVSSSVNMPFWIYVNDVLQSDRSYYSICLQNIPAGDFYVRVEIDNQPHNCVGQYITMNNRNISLVLSQQSNYFGLRQQQTAVQPEWTMSLVMDYNHNGNGMQQPIVIQNNNYQSYPCMQETDFNQALAVINQQSYDNTRLTVAKQLVANNQLCAQQIIDVCKAFSFENNKLEFAKYAYPYCTEQNKYYLVNSVFTYESSKRELDEFIGGL